ncbi:MAG: 4-hydroxy-tetrahydrodipicolinate reductase [Oscillospiraceae bacterium]|jgi:4-hydroxy-tetrahydrodipicolinate reductase|nr:4-hydroxy-tetrahydrodipicolinate reductase [Oscillospiraceae bacterium]
MVRMLISGALGYMGRAVAELAAAEPDIACVGGIDPRADAWDGPRPAFPLFAGTSLADAQADVLVDFSHPSALPGLLDFAVRRRLALVLATTGYAPEDERRIRDAARHVAVFQSANMSYGVTLLCELAHTAAAALGDGFDAEIVEKHHRRKLDAPSGTALMLAQAMRAAYAREKALVLDRPERHAPRDAGQIGIVSVRGGTVPGEHQVGFYGEDEIIELRHTAQSRRIFAAGALRAARYVAPKAAGLYSMQQLLLEQSLVTHIAVDRDVAVMALAGVAATPGAISALFQAIRDINIDMISQTPPADGGIPVAFSLPQADLARAVRAIAAMAGPYRIAEHLVKLTVEGAGMAHAPGVAARIFRCLAESDVAAHLITTSETKVSVCVDAACEQRAVRAIEAEFGLTGQSPRT